MNTAYYLFCAMTALVIFTSCSSSETYESRKAAAVRYLQVYPRNPLLRGASKEQMLKQENNPELCDIIIEGWRRTDWQAIEKVRQESLIKTFTAAELEELMDKGISYATGENDPMRPELRKKCNAYLHQYGILGFEEEQRAYWDAYSEMKHLGQQPR